MHPAYYIVNLFNGMEGRKSYQIISVPPQTSKRLQKIVWAITTGGSQHLQGGCLDDTVVLTSPLSVTDANHTVCVKRKHKKTLFFPNKLK